jgi:hypothetical protein
LTKKVGLCTYGRFFSETHLVTLPTEGHKTKGDMQKILPKNFVQNLGPNFNSIAYIGKHKLAKISPNQFLKLFLKKVVTIWMDSFVPRHIL